MPIMLIGLALLILGLVIVGFVVMSMFGLAALGFYVILGMFGLLMAGGGLAAIITELGLI